MEFPTARKRKTPELCCGKACRHGSTEQVLHDFNSLSSTSVRLSQGTLAWARLAQIWYGEGQLRAVAVCSNTPLALGAHIHWELGLLWAQDLAQADSQAKVATAPTAVMQRLKGLPDPIDTPQSTSLAQLQATPSLQAVAAINCSPAKCGATPNQDFVLTWRRTSTRQHAAVWHRAHFERRFSSRVCPALPPCGPCLGGDPQTAYPPH